MSSATTTRAVCANVGGRSVQPLAVLATILIALWIIEPSQLPLTVAADNCISQTTYLNVASCGTVDTLRLGQSSN